MTLLSNRIRSLVSGMGGKRMPLRPLALHEYYALICKAKISNLQALRAYLDDRRDFPVL
jgi:hypothetical protein